MALGNVDDDCARTANFMETVIMPQLPNARTRTNLRIVALPRNGKDKATWTSMKMQQDTHFPHRNLIDPKRSPIRPKRIPALGARQWEAIHVLHYAWLNLLHHSEIISPFQTLNQYSIETVNRTVSSKVTKIQITKEVIAPEGSFSMERHSTCRDILSREAFQLSHEIYDI